MLNKNFLLIVALMIAISIDIKNGFSQQELSGRAVAIAGDTLRLINDEDKSKTLIRLWGVDAPELEQHCETKNGRSIDCGLLARDALDAIISRKNLTCVDFEKDTEGQLTALCYLGDQILNGSVVRSGWAMAYRKESMDSVGLEKQARLGEKGIWEYKFDKPWLWRKSRKKTN